MNDNFLLIKEAYDWMVQLNNDENRLLFKENIIQEDEKKLAL
jgi:hypothetical protein